MLIVDSRNVKESTKIQPLRNQGIKKNMNVNGKFYISVNKKVTKIKHE